MPNVIIDAVTIIRFLLYSSIPNRVRVTKFEFDKATETRCCDVIRFRYRSHEYVMLFSRSNFYFHFFLRKEKEKNFI